MKIESARRVVIRVSCLLLSFAAVAPAGLEAQTQYFAGAMGGIATLSADARSEIAAASSAVSLYKPENGPTIQIFGGAHFTDYLSVEVNYVWYKNNETLTSLLSGSSGSSQYEQSRNSTGQSVSGDLLVYFRNRTSRIRPYLAIGIGVDRFASAERGTTITSGNLPLPPNEFVSTGPAVRFPVGIDVLTRHGFAIRYSFTETIRDNPLSAQLSPPGLRRLATYQNLFGLVKYF